MKSIKFFMYNMGTETIPIFSMDYSYLVYTIYRANLTPSFLIGKFKWFGIFGPNKLNKGVAASRSIPQMFGHGFFWVVAISK